MDALLRGFAVLLLALAGGAARAQGPVVVSGQVTDAATGLPVEDASVSIADQLKYTDAGGRYMLDPVAPGSAEVQVSAKGYLALDKTKIRIAADQASHNFKLIRAATISGRDRPLWVKASGGMPASSAASGNSSFQTAR